MIFRRLTWVLSHWWHWAHLLGPPSSSVSSPWPGRRRSQRPALARWCRWRFYSPKQTPSHRMQEVLREGNKEHRHSNNWDILICFFKKKLNGRTSPVRTRMIKTANMSGYSARIPGASIVMYRRQKSSMCRPISSSKVALQARATLEVPAVEAGIRG